jgi:hypothetical protein
VPNIADRKYGLTTVASQALENSHVLVTPSTFGFGGPFVLDNLTVFNFDTATGYMILIFDSTSVPNNASPVVPVPVYWAFVGVATASVPTFVGIDWTQVALKCKNGITVVGSSILTTPFNLTAATNSKLAFLAQVAA